MAGLYNAFHTFSQLHCCCITNNQLTDTIAACNKNNVSFHHIQKPLDKKWSVWKNRLVSLVTLTNLPFSEQISAKLNQIIQEVQPDLLWMETPYLIRTILSIKTKCPLAVDYWGTALGIKRELKMAGFAEKIWQFLRYIPAYNAEHKYAKKPSAIITVSKEDACYFNKLTKHHAIFPLPLAMLTDNEEDISHIEPIKNSMIMTGDLSYQPNIDAAIFFAEEIFPLIKKEIKDATAFFVGRNPAKAVMALMKYEGIKVIGDVPSLKQYILQAQCYILPMRLGSGIRSKLLEVFPLERPIVSTDTGIEGFAMEPGKHFLLANNPHDFAAAICRLLKDEKLRRELALNAKNQAIKLYSQEAITESLKDICKKIVEDGF
jgi:glycosyltransferase involved in cell wall biosynthesis